MVSVCERNYLVGERAVVVRCCMVDAYRAGSKDEEGSQGVDGIELRGQIDRLGY